MAEQCACGAVIVQEELVGLVGSLGVHVEVLEAAMCSEKGRHRFLSDTKLIILTCGRYVCIGTDWDAEGRPQPLQLVEHNFFLVYDPATVRCRSLSRKLCASVWHLQEACLTLKREEFGNETVCIDLDGLHKRTTRYCGIRHVLKSIDVVRHST